MTLLHILIFTIMALLTIGLRRGHGWALLVFSVLAVYWVQPSTPIRYLDFWLPTATLGLAALVWVGTSETGETRSHRENWIAVLLIGGIVLAVGATRYLPESLWGSFCCLTPTRPPALWAIILVLGFLSGLGALINHRLPNNPRFQNFLIILLLGLFLTIKTEPWALAASAGLRTITGQSADLASALDLRWLGFSYLAFRLIHTLRDRLTGRLPSLSLREYITYALFFPAFTAGPIDRIQRFTPDLRAIETPDFDQARGELLIEGGQRIVIGIFKKFVIADTLALIALNATNAAQTRSTGWLWVLLYAYAFRIYFDFSGYTDIAIGLGRLVGLKLPENFERPYLKPNLTLFWNSWHITLAQWFRAYFFNPLTRALRSSPKQIPLPLIVLTGQLSTMLLIGLWHGVTWNFVLWGLWHGLGLYLHNRWGEATKTRLAGLAPHPRLQRILAAGGILLTFHYVTLGWVWFALPSVELSSQVFLKLFNL